MTGSAGSMTVEALLVCPLCLQTTGCIPLLHTDSCPKPELIRQMCLFQWPCMLQIAMSGAVVLIGKAVCWKSG